MKPASHEGQILCNSIDMRCHSSDFQRSQIKTQEVEWWGQRLGARDGKCYLKKAVSAEEKMKTVLVVPTSPQCEWTMSQTVYLKWLKINFRVRIFL